MWLKCPNIVGYNCLFAVLSTFCSADAHCKVIYVFRAVLLWLIKTIKKTSAKDKSENTKIKTIIVRY